MTMRALATYLTGRVEGASATSTAVSKWEAGVHIPDPKQCQALALVLQPSDRMFVFEVLYRAGHIPYLPPATVQAVRRDDVLRALEQIDIGLQALRAALEDAPPDPELTRGELEEDRNGIVTRGVHNSGKDALQLLPEPSQERDEADGDLTTARRPRHPGLARFAERVQRRHSQGTDLPR